MLRLYVHCCAIQAKIAKRAQILFTDESGATAMEYGLIAALIAVVLIGVLTRIGTNMNVKFQSVATSLH